MAISTFSNTNFISIPEIINGDDSNNTLQGTTGNDTINGLAGNDTLIGGTGNDTLNGGAGNDTADYSQIGQSITLSPTGIITKGGGLGNDQLIQVETIIADASAVNNTIDVSTAGNAASINVNLQTQQLTVNGVPGVGTFTVTNFDHVQGTSQNDTIIGDTQNNQLSGNAGNDTLIGGAGNDTLNGGEGNDTADYSQIGQSITLSPTGIITKGGGLGNDQLIQVETIIADASAVNNTIDVSTAGNAASINVNLQTQQLTVNGVPGVGTFTVTNFDNVQGTSQNDTIIGDTQNNQLSGNAGNDTIFGGTGNDTLNGGEGNDTADYSQLGQSITLSPTGIITKGGGLGNDQLIQVETIIADASAVNNTIDVSTGGNAASINVNLQTQQLTVNGVPGVGTFTVTNFDNVQGTSQNDSITGDTQNNQLSGNAGNDTLIGNAGNDTLNGGAGTDTLIGGLGDDIYIVDSATDTITENISEGTDTIQSSLTYSIATKTNIENLTLTGTTAINGTGNAANNVITGNSGNNTLNGGAGNDTLDGGGGIDALIGGTGNDIYIVDSITDIIAENANEGTDTIQSSVTYSIAAKTNIENLTLTGTTAINGTGNAANNVITGNSGNNTINGGAGNDTLDGGGGIDVLIGGTGNDIYIVDSTTDTITENASSGTDTIQSSVTYTIATLTNVENLTLTGTTAINATGNAANNVITGNSGNNTLDGGAGIDTLIGGTGDDIYIVDSTTDTITELTSGGTDTIQSRVTYTIAINIENLTLTGAAAINGTGNAANNVLTGNSANNTLTGGAGNDTLDGGVGNDNLIGGLGDDIYIVDSITDIVTENVNEGTDTIQSSVTFTLATNVENLTLTGTTAINGTGNAANNVIIGNGADNTLDGGAGNDTLNGGEGIDTLIGGAGNDTLNGGEGIDTLIGGLGDDIYFLDDISDNITENANEGTDTVFSTTDYALSDNIENLILTGTAANGTGNTANNIITGNAADNVLDGDAGIDTLIGGLGDDTYFVDNSSDSITENANEGTDTVYTTINYTLSANIENLNLIGTAANGTGNAVNNIIIGNEINNTLDGAAGIDTLIGGDGNDIYVVDSTTDIITEELEEGTDTIQSSVTYTIAALANVENLTLTGGAEINGIGNAANNLITGNTGNNSLDGGTGNDTLNGGAGTDTLIGGTGDDTYIVDSTTDTITENAGEGTDTIQSSVTYTIAALANVENLTLTGTTAINGTGNAANNVITSNTANNILDGGAGTDTLIGGTGDDIYIVDSTTDTITENAGEGTDTIQSSVTYTIAALANVENLTLTGTTAINGTGNAANNVITGNTANNILDGGAGTDTLIGGTGDDIYIVDSTTDTIIENVGEGTDTIQSSVTYTIAALANVENLTLTGITAINGTGNGANNVITGNAANNILDGGAGTDTLIGGTGNDIYIVDSTTDTIIENVGEGTDTIQSSVTYTIAALANVENLTLTGTTAINGTGNGANNVITGNAANNILDGGAGTDTLIGGTGNDIYIVDSTTDTITENVGEGTDTIQSSVTYTIAALANVEYLTLTGTTAINGTGNAANNVITGNSANNTLTGGLGKDTLTGGLGVDRFDYRTLADSVFSNFDVITDFSANTGNDLFLVTTARTGFSNAGSVAILDTTQIAAKLTTATFTANAAAQFSFGNRSFVAINDTTAGFGATTDAIIEVTGLTGTLGLNNFTTTLV
ncbi:MAG: hypothetical protein HEP80_05730 [Dolichospermum sp. UKL201]|nr:MAG: hypothetical protein HEP80_05730 [Dolichospermum sp. UKL201]